MAFREDKAALQALLQKGSVKDDLWTAFLAAEKELEAELVEVVQEANSFREGWGGFIFQSASEMVNNLKHRDLFVSIPRMKAEAGSTATSFAAQHAYMIPCRRKIWCKESQVC